MPLSHKDIALIRGMLSRGDRQSDIAAYFGINGGRVAEINTGQRFPNIRPAPRRDLPPPGPYFVSARAQQMARDELRAARATIDAAIALLDQKAGE